ncbi:MAG TPA: NCS2 family permease [Chthoniobacterales bacterium]
MNFIDKFFRLSENGTSIRQEVTGGLTTFAAMAYVLAVNPLILKNAGMDFGALITATALSAALMTIVMALMTNYPLALAPGMGLNAFFAFSVCIGMKIPWQAALGLVFYGGLLFLILSLTGVRQKLVEAIPMDIKLAITCGIGIFIAFIGLKSAGIVVANPATLVTIGDFRSALPWLCILGVILTAALVVKNVRGAVIISILVITILGLLITGPDGRKVTSFQGVFSLPNSLAPSFAQLDLGYLWKNFGHAFPLVLGFLFVDLFDNMGTLIGVCNRAGLLDKSGNLPKIGQAFTADSCAAMAGAVLGTSTVTSYVESAAGVEAGARTGLSSIVVAILFLLSLFLTPVIMAIPAVATAPALIIVGIFMTQGILEIDLADFAKAVPAFVTIVTMPLTFSISEGIALGFLVYVVLQIALGKAKEIKPLAWILGLLFIAHYVFQLGHH